MQGADNFMRTRGNMANATFWNYWKIGLKFCKLTFLGVTNQVIYKISLKQAK